MRHLPLALLALRYVVALQVSTEDYEQQELDLMESRRHAWYAGRNRSNATDDSKSPPSASSNETELADRRFGPAGRSHKQKTNELKQRIKESNDLCKAKRWNCNRSCYLLKLPGTQCREPAPTDRCFDVAIRYNYTGDLDAPFPHHLEALSRFPTCWASLAPLICAWYYRPCGTWRTLEISGISVHEFSQVYPYSSCERARAACKDVIELGGWPDFLDCDAHTVPVKDLHRLSKQPNLNRTLFGSGEGECKFMYDKIRAVSPSSCIQPLADLPKVHLYTSTLSSVLDACYMPCRTPNAKNSWILRCALLVSLALLVFAVYLVSSKLNKKVREPITTDTEAGNDKHVAARQSLRRQEEIDARKPGGADYCQRKNYRWSGLARASLTCALVNATAYYVLWTIFVMFESNTTCLANSEIRRPSSIERIDSCQVQSFVMHFLTLATYAHVALATLSLWKSDYDNDICVAAIAVIYLITAGVGWALPHFTGVGVDGVTGICHFGLRHGLHSVPGLLSVTASGAVLFAIIAYLAVFSTYRGSRTVREQELLDIRLRNLTQHQQNQHLLDGKNSPPVASIQPRTFVPLAITIIIVIAAPLLTIESMFPGFNESIERAHIKDSVRCTLARSLDNSGVEHSTVSAINRDCHPVLDLDSYRAGVALKLILLPILTILLAIVSWLLRLDQWVKAWDHVNSDSSSTLFADDEYNELDDVSVRACESLLPSTAPPVYHKPQPSQWGVPSTLPKRVANSDSGVVRDCDYASSRQSSIAGRRRRRRSVSSAPPRAEDLRRGVHAANVPHATPFTNPNHYYEGSYASEAYQARYGRPEDQVHDNPFLHWWMQGQQLLNRLPTVPSPYLQWPLSQMAMNQQAQVWWALQQASMVQGAQAPPFLTDMPAGQTPAMHEADTHTADDRKRHRSYENRPRRVRRMASLDPTASDAAVGASMGARPGQVQGTSSSSSNEYTPYPNVPMPNTMNARPRVPGQIDRRRGSEPVSKRGPPQRRSHTAPGTPTRASGGHRPSDLTAQKEQDNPLQTKFDSPFYVMKDQNSGPYQRVMGMVEVQRGNDPPQLYPTLIELRPAENGRQLRLCPPSSTHVNETQQFVSNAVPPAYFQNARMVPTTAASQQNAYSREQANARASPPDIVRSAFPQQVPQQRLSTPQELNDSERELYHPSSASSSSETDELSTDSGEYPS